MPKREVDEKLCTRCEVCSDVCPTDSVSFSPFPEFGDNCIFCYNCVRDCPEEAIKADFSLIEERIRDRAKQVSERPFTQIFV